MNKRVFVRRNTPSARYRHVDVTKSPRDSITRRNQIEPYQRTTRNDKRSPNSDELAPAVESTMRLIEPSWLIGPELHPHTRHTYLDCWCWCDRRWTPAASRRSPCPRLRVAWVPARRKSVKLRECDIGDSKTVRLARRNKPASGSHQKQCNDNALTREISCGTVTAR